MCAFMAGQMTDYIIGLHAMRELATNGDSVLIIVNKILVGDSGLRGVTHVERGYIFRMRNE